MKKLFTLLMATLMCSFCSYANDDENDENSTKWIIRAGTNFANATDLDDEPEGLGTKVGYDIAMSFQRPIANIGLFWGMELATGTRGFSWECPEDGSVVI